MSEGSEVFEGRVPAMVRLQLGELVAANGAEILEDPRRVRAMLADTASTAVREINLINLALSLGVPERLAAAAGDPLRLQTEIETLTRQLERNHSLQRDAADWAVRSCGWSLGLIAAPADLEPVATAPSPSPLAPAPEVTRIPESEPEPEPEPEPPRAVDPVEPPGVVAPPSTPRQAVTGTEARREEPPGPKRMILVIGAIAVALVVIVVGVAVVAGGGGGGGDGATASSTPAAPRQRFTAAERQLMDTLPAIAPQNACTPQASQSSIDCAVTVEGADAQVQYFAHDSPEAAAKDAFFFVPRDTPDAPAPTTWTTAQGQSGGTVQRWVTHPSGDELHHLAWTFKVGDTYYAATTSDCCGAGAGSALDRWWQTDAITSSDLASVESP